MMMISKIFRKIRNFARIRAMSRVTTSSISISASVDPATTIEGRNEIRSNAILVRCHIGYASYISKHCAFFNTDIGRYCSIAPEVQVLAGNHPTKDHVSTHPLFYAVKRYADLSYNVDRSFKEYSTVPDTEDRYLIIGNDVWIGTGAMLVNGITVGDGAIIAAGSVVTKSVPPYAIAGGVPAKVMRYRFEDSDIDFLLRLRWWERDERWILEHAALFNNIKSLRARIEHSADGQEGTG